ncbi:MAG: hypothetical protein ABH816_02055 [Candidatus Levyibacteriota bacterium]
MVEGLEKLAQELKENLFSPEAVTNFWQAKLQADGKRIGLNISVPKCDWTEDEIRKPMVDNKGREVPSMMVYLPQELTGQEGLKKLGQMYPDTNSWIFQEGVAHGASKKYGWIKVEAAINAPNLNTTESDLEEHAKKKGYSMQRLNVYILASQASKDLTGHYLDEQLTYSRLGFRHGSDAVYFSFNQSGSLLIHWPLGSKAYGPEMGGRFEEVKKA